MDLTKEVVTPLIIFLLKVLNLLFLQTPQIKKMFSAIAEQVNAVDEFEQAYARMQHFFVSEE